MRPTSCNSRLVPLAGGLALLVPLWALGCVERGTTSPEVTGVRAAKGGNGGGPPSSDSEDDVTVDDTDPRSAPQETTLDVEVFGSGFEDGADAEFLLDGESTPDIKTNSTTFVSSERLTANITIAGDATLDKYDVQVANPPPRGKKGIGIELFEVTFNPSDEVPVSMTLADGDHDGDGSAETVDRITSDGGGAYMHNVDEVDARIDTNGGGLIFRLGDSPRTLNLDFRHQVRDGACVEDDSCVKNFDQVTKTPPGAVEIVDPVTGDEVRFLNMPQGTAMPARVRICFNHPHPEMKHDPRYCVRFRFGDIALDHSTHAVIERVDDSVWILEAFAAFDDPSDRAFLNSKFKHRGPEQVQDEGSYSMPFKMRIACMVPEQCQ